MAPQRKRIGSLEVLRIDAPNGAKDGPVVVLFHGYGASMEDLAPLGDMLNRQVGRKDVTWIFPNGHQKIDIGGHMEGRAWFPISVSELEKAMAGKEAIDLSQIVPPGLKKARELALHMIAALKVPSEKIILGGFSQGAMLSTELTMRMATPPAGLALLSGTLVCADDWTTGAKGVAEKLGAKKFTYFQSHGQRDTVLNFGMAQKLEKMLVGAGWQGQLMSFHGGHEIPPEVLMQLAGYLRKTLSSMPQ